MEKQQDEEDSWKDSHKETALTTMAEDGDREFKTAKAEEYSAFLQNYKRRLRLWISFQADIALRRKEDSI